jgi:hypothetical protein
MATGLLMLVIGRATKIQDLLMSEDKEYVGTLTLGATTYYFRHGFNVSGNPGGARARLRVMVDDGCVVYLNGREVLRVRMPAGPVAYETMASENVGNAVYEGPFDIPSDALRPGANVVAAEVHQNNLNSSDIVFALSLEATVPAVSGRVVLNEIAARNTGSVASDGRAPDWIELFNAGSTPVDLGGMSLTDDVLAPAKFTFPVSTTIVPQGFLIVWCDDATNAPGIHTGFGLSDRGQTLALLATGAAGYSVQDFVTFGLQLPDLTIGRVADGKGAWQLTQPTPGRPNTGQALAPAGSLRLNEWMAAPASGDDWFELHNGADLPLALAGLYLTDDPTRLLTNRVAELSYIGARDFQVFVADGRADRGADHVDFRLSANGEALAVVATNGVTRLDEIAYGPQAAGVSQGRLPDGADTVVAFGNGPSPGDPNYLPLTNVVINEVLAHSDPPLEDAIELRNTGPGPVDISGWWLSDERRQPRKFQIPAGSTLAAGGFVVFYENQFNPDTNAPTSFALSSAHGDELLLSQADAAGRLTGFRARVDFGPTAAGVSVGRVATSVGHDFTELAARTFGFDVPGTVAEFRRGRGLENGPARVGPVVISEIMFHPPALGTNDNRRDEFVELFNRTQDAVALFDPAHPTNTWRLRDAVDFDFPPGVTIPAGGALIVVGFDPAAAPEQRAAFEKAYGAGLRLYGPFAGKLNNADGHVELRQPDAPLDLPGPDFGEVPYVRADHVHYRGQAPWPAGASGTGASLQRRGPADYGNDPVNWQAALPTPGRAGVSGGESWRLEASMEPGGGGVLRVRAMGLGAAALILQRSADLRQWIDVSTNRATGGLAMFLEPPPSVALARYYRVVVVR